METYQITSEMTISFSIRVFSSMKISLNNLDDLIENKFFSKIRLNKQESEEFNPQVLFRL